jgi:hypothetical protein
MLSLPPVSISEQPPDACAVQSPFPGARLTGGLPSDPVFTPAAQAMPSRRHLP